MSALEDPAATDEQRRRMWDGNGKPDHAEHAYSALMAAHHTPIRDEADRWFRSAQVHAQLALRESNQDLAMAMREQAAATAALADAQKELSLSNDAMTDELRRRRGLPERAE